jgi:N-terminal domain of reverse transcriptase
MLRSRANALVSVRRVTEINAGRKTAGVDGKVVVTAQDKVEWADWVQHRARPWSPGQSSEYMWCAVWRLVVSPAQQGGTWRNVSGSDGLPEAERSMGQEHAIEAVVW